MKGIDKCIWKEYFELSKPKESEKGYICLFCAGDDIDCYDYSIKKKENIFLSLLNELKNYNDFGSGI